MRQPCQAFVATLAVLVWSIFYIDGVISAARCVDKPNEKCQDNKEECKTNALAQLGLCCDTCCGGDITNVDCCGPACNHGACIQIDGDYKAQCNCSGTGYHGTYCKSDDCDSNPCVHGFCVNHYNGKLSCNCNSTGYTGEHCNITYCETRPCVRGVCTNKPDGFSCDCTGTRYIGDRCNTATCETKPCVRGVCTDTPDGFSCGCTGTGYIGRRCTTTCSSLLNCGIHNSTDQTGSVCVCACLDGYTNGDLHKETCVDVDECVSQQDVCGEKKCVNIPGSFKCEDVSSIYAESFVDSFPGKAIGVGLAAGAIVFSSVGAALMIGNVFKQITGKDGLLKRKNIQDIDAKDMKGSVVQTKKSSSSSSASKQSLSSCCSKNDEGGITAFIKSYTSFSLSSLLMGADKTPDVDFTIEETAEPDKSRTSFH